TGFPRSHRPGERAYADAAPGRGSEVARDHTAREGLEARRGVVDERADGDDTAGAGNRLDDQRARFHLRLRRVQEAEERALGVAGEAVDEVEEPERREGRNRLVDTEGVELPVLARGCRVDREVHRIGREVPKPAVRGEDRVTGSGLVDGRGHDERALSRSEEAA